MEDTIIYLIRHAETVQENGIRNTNEDTQIINEKEILSVHGEEQSKRLSQNAELNNIDVICQVVIQEQKPLQNILQITIICLLI